MLVRGIRLVSVASIFLVAALAEAVGTAADKAAYSSRENDINGQPCDDCPLEKLRKSLTAEQRAAADADRLEYEKNKLLQRLGLSSPPNTEIEHEDIPDHLLQKFAESVSQTRQSSESESHGKPVREVIIDGQKIGTGQAATNHHCIGTSGRISSCFMLQFRPELLHGYRIQSAVLRIFKTLEPGSSRNETVQILEKVRDATEERTLSTVVATVSADKGWKQLELTDVVRGWVDELDERSMLNDDLSLLSKSIEVVCLTCADKSKSAFDASSESHRPTLRVKTEQPKRRKMRDKFGGPCRPGLYSHCCKQDFYVNFTQVGFSKWIIQPPGYWANYCAGSCATFDKPALRPSLNIRNRLASATNWVPCCAPTVMESLKIVFMDDTGAFKTRVLPNMVVKECGCS